MAELDVRGAVEAGVALLVGLGAAEAGRDRLGGGALAGGGSGRGFGGGGGGAGGVW